MGEFGSSSGPDNGLVDVTVCDICGDTGREELLATCARCIYGAEHTYCMRVKLEKIPEGDWLCEECGLVEERKKENKNKSALIVYTRRHTPRMETNQDIDNKNKTLGKRARLPEKETNCKKQCDRTDSYAGPSHSKSNMVIDLEQPAQIEDQGVDMSMIDFNELPPEIKEKDENPSFEPDTVPVVPSPLFVLVRVKEEDEEEDKSLSLTIGLPGSSSEVERENEIKPVLKQFLPETPGVKKGQFRIFGEFMG